VLSLCALTSDVNANVSILLLIIQVQLVRIEVNSAEKKFCTNFDFFSYLINSVFIF